MNPVKGISQDSRRVVEYARKLGFSVTRTKRHLKFTRPGSRTVFFSRTPSDLRACRNVKSELRRAVAGIADRGSAFSAVLGESIEGSVESTGRTA